MATYKITSPDGQAYNITAPDEASQDEVMAYAQRNFKMLAKEPVKAAPISRTEKIGQGMKDSFDGGAQLLTNILPNSVVKAGNAANNWLADKTGLVARLPEGGVNEQVKQNEQAYQAKRTAAGESGFDGYRTIGNVLSPANLALATKMPVAASLAGKIATSATGGAASALLNPVTEGDYWGGKGTQVATGAAFAGAMPVIAGGLARVISPNASRNANIATLKAEGVKPTIGQTLGGFANTMEEKAQSLPIIGDAISAARRQGVEQLNRAAFNRALGPVGKKLPIDVPLGNEAVAHTGKVLGDAYEALLPKLTAQADQPFFAKLTSLKSMVDNGALDPKYPALFEKTLANRVIGKFQGQNAMTGQTLKDTESFLSNEIKRFGQSQDPDARLIGDAFKEVQSELRDLVARNNPQYASELKAINTGWANFKRIQRAAGAVGADEGVFTPAQLQNAVKAGDKSKDKARFAEGKALMQDLSGAAKTTMTGKIPDSGTAGRLMLGAGGLSAGLLNPLIPAGLLGGAGLYTAPMQSLLRGAVSTRGQSAKAIADATKKAQAVLVPGGAQLGLGLLN